MTTSVTKRLPHRSFVLAVLLAIVSSPETAWSGCGRDHGHAAADGGLQVQVDPKTGAYSMPEPGTLPADPADGARQRSVGVEPGTTAAGGYKVKLNPSASTQAAPPVGEKK